MSNQEPTLAGGFLKEGSSYIKNPLGIIGLFIGLIYGIAVLVAGFSPNLTEGQRWAMIIFAVVFPIPILGVFFRLVTRHHTKLYAPGDWRDERNFFGPQTAQVREEREASEAQLLAEAPTQTPLPAPTAAHEPEAIKKVERPAAELPGSPTQARALAKEGEDLAFGWLAEQFPQEKIYRNIGIDGPNKGVAFDGIVARPRGRHLVAIEVKVIRDPRVIPKIVAEFGSAMGLAVANVQSAPNPGTIAFMLVIVTVGMDAAERHVVDSLAKRLFQQQERMVDLRVIDLEELQKYRTW